MFSVCLFTPFLNFECLLLLYLKILRIALTSMARGRGLCMTFPGLHMTFRTLILEYAFAFHFRVIKELVTSLRARVNTAVQHCSTIEVNLMQRDSKYMITHHGSLQPPSGQSVSKSATSRRTDVRSGCLSHFTGNPSYTWPPCFNSSKNRFHTSSFMRAPRKVWAFPIKISASRARDNRTFSRSGDLRNPIS